MMKRWAGAAILAFAATTVFVPSSDAAVYSRSMTVAGTEAQSALLAPVQYWRGPPPRFGPRFGGPRFVGPPRGYFYRPWYRRPYYGTIIGGIALGTIIGVTAYGLAPRPPRPDLCWYWADRPQSRGYWDYC
jgi:hypothetical protein